VIFIVLIQILLGFAAHIKVQGMAHKVAFHLQTGGDAGH
jgi:hypothetical protein